MTDISKLVENAAVAVVVSDENFNVLYANPRCKQIFKDLLNMENFVGKHMGDCHKPETMEKLKTLYQEYKEKKRTLDYYTMDIPDGTATIVNVPVYDDGRFSGVMEFIFESALA